MSVLKHRWSVANNYLAGITAGTWRRLLRENAPAVDAPYWHRAAFITASSLMNSWHAQREARRHGAEVARTPLAGPPLFVLGHWRSGTTHLHNLLALDRDQFGYANTYQVVNPLTFLTTEDVNTRRFAWLVPSRRPMDNMALSFAAPQEDEFGPGLMTLRTPYLGISFPRRQDHYERYLTFRGVPAAELGEWKEAMVLFLRKLTFKQGRSLVLKSPTHTARIRILLELFPDARFVHIHRDPFVVFQSFLHYHDTAVWYTYLQRPDVAGITERILRRYRELYDVFFEERRLIPPGRFHEVSFAELDHDPVRTVGRIYEALGLAGFASVEPRLQDYVASLRGYERNRFPELAPALRRRIAGQWRRTFEEWGYPS